MKLTNLQCQTLFNALSKLDACKFAKSADGKLRYNIARNLRVLKVPLEVLEDTRVSLVKSVKKDGSGMIQPGTPAYEEFFEQWRDVLKADAGELDLRKLDWENLDAESNAIAPSTLADLELVMDGGPQ